MKAIEINRLKDQYKALKEQDPELLEIIIGEHTRQSNSINLIASENYIYKSVLESTSSLLINKYSEGRIGERYYGGTFWIDKLESLCQKRALSLFNLNPDIWGVNVQAYSGSIANFCVYTALVPPRGKIMGLDLPSGGHITHGYQTKNRKVSASSLYFESRSYKIDKDDLVDYEGLEKAFMEFMPQILICGYSAYSRDLDYKKMKSIAEKNSSYLMADISHIAPFVACNLMNDPFEQCDVVTTTTHKGLRGPRGALIFYRKCIYKFGKFVDLEERINSAVFPKVQGGPHNHTIAGIACALGLAKKSEFLDYSKSVIENSRALSLHLESFGFNILTGGTDNHIVLINLKNKGIYGYALERMCDILGISINRNMIPNDSSPLCPSGIRLGTYAITTRGLRPENMAEIAEIINEITNFCKKITRDENLSKEEFWRRICDGNWLENPKCLDIRKKISDISQRFPLPDDFSDRKKHY